MKTRRQSYCFGIIIIPSGMMYFLSGAGEKRSVWTNMEKQKDRWGATRWFDIWNISSVWRCADWWGGGGGTRERGRHRVSLYLAWGAQIFFQPRRMHERFPLSLLSETPLPRTMRFYAIICRWSESTFQQPQKRSNLTWTPGHRPEVCFLPP